MFSMRQPVCLRAEAARQRAVEDRTAPIQAECRLGGRRASCRIFCARAAGIEVAVDPDLMTAAQLDRVIAALSGIRRQLSDGPPPSAAPRGRLVRCRD